MANIYELTNDYLYLMELMEDPEVDPQTVADTMESIEGELEDKADSYARIIRNLEGEKAAIKAEVDRLNTRKKTIDNNIIAMKQRLQMMMETTGKIKFKTDLFSFGIQRNAPKLIIDTDNILSIPEEYLRFVDPEVDKTAIKEAIQNGVDLSEYAHLEESSSLRIK